MNHLNVKFPSLNLHQKAESVEVLGKGLTTNIFKIYNIFNNLQYF